MTLVETIARYRRELRADPLSLRFVPLAEALRKAGRMREAEDVLADGLMHHPGLNSARLVLARVYADTQREPAALQLLDELYPRDAGNVALVELYLTLLLDAERADEARVLLDRAEIIGVPEQTRAAVRRRLDAELWAEQESQAPVVTPLGPNLDPRHALGEPVTLPDTSLASFGDPFAVPAVAARLEAAGRAATALRIWEEVALMRPDTPGLARQIAALRLATEHSSVPVSPEALTPLPRPHPGPAGVAALRAFLERLTDAP